jgi:GDP-L-fucose synthase
MEQSARIYIAGHRGLVGSALYRRLQTEGFTYLITHTHAELDLTNQQAVHTFFAQERPDYVFLAAAKVGGIHANSTYPAEFIYQNLMIEANVIHAAYQYGVKRLLFLGSSCIYPRLATQPMREDALLTGTLEPTNEPYAIAKIAGIKLCESYNRQYHTDFRSVMPTNLYGPHDNFDLENSHVVPALIRKFHTAKINNAPFVQIWGSGKVRREFLHVDDMVMACIHLMRLDTMPTESMFSHLNVGTGKEVTIRELAELMKEVVGFQGNLVFDTTQPDGAPQKLLDVSRLVATGWQPQIDLRNGLTMTYQWFVENLATAC